MPPGSEALPGWNVTDMPVASSDGGLGSRVTSTHFEDIDENKLSTPLTYAENAAILNVSAKDMLDRIRDEAPRIDDPLLTNPHLFDFQLNKTILQGLNLTEKAEKANELVLAAEDHWRIRSGYKFPLAQIARALVNESAVFPTIFPGQQGPVPRLRDEGLCNPEVTPGGCVTAAELGRAIGEPLQQLLSQTNLFRWQQNVEDILLSLHDRVTRGLTGPMIDTLEMEPTVNLIETLALSAKRPVTILQSENMYFQTYNNVSEEMWYQPLDEIDLPLDQKADIKAAKKEILNRALCDDFNNRLPNCRNRTADPILAELSPLEPFFGGPADTSELKVPLPGDDQAGMKVPVSPAEMMGDAPGGILSHNGPVPVGGKRNREGFWTHVYVYGFDASCQANGACVAGSAPLQPELFDGYYQFDSVNENNGSPIYVKVDPIANFRGFGTINKLYLWQQRVELPSTSGSMQEGLWATITPQAPSFDYTYWGSRPPYAFYAGSEPPKGCSKLADFPTCVSSDQGHWRFARMVASTCTGISYTNLCVFPLKVVIFPTLHPMVVFPSYADSSAEN